jgi:hypothetical protein
MFKSNMMLAGCVCMVLTVVLLLVACERYSSNAKTVKSVNQLLSNSPTGKMTTQSILRPNIPVATTYSIFFAVISGVAGAVLLGSSQKNP